MPCREVLRYRQDTGLRLHEPFAYLERADSGSAGRRDEWDLELGTLGLGSSAGLLLLVRTLWLLAT